MLKRISAATVLALVLLSAVCASQLVTSAPAMAAEPTVAETPAVAEMAPLPVVGAFNAPLCAGTTTNNPLVGTAPRPDGSVAALDLTRVFGQRLTDYNNSQVVVLYNNRGQNQHGYVPNCGTRFVEGVGAVSEWMFCTDEEAHTCNKTNSEGKLLDQDGNPIEGQLPVPNNPKLTVDQEKIIAYLIQNGHTFFEDGVQLPDASLESSEARLHLQQLVWCISDPDPAKVHCDENMDAAEQARILTLIPDEPIIELELNDAGTPVRPGDTVEFTLTTNLYEQPIQLAFSGVAGTPSVISGPAELAGDVLTVHGADPTEMAEIVIGFTSEEVGEVTLDASAQPASTSHIGWNQSPGVAADGKACQVYATFNVVDQLEVNATATAAFEAAAQLGSFAVTKSVVNDGALDVPADYDVTYDCTVDPDNTPVASGTLTLVPGVVQRVTDLPAGAECQLIEESLADPAGGTWTDPVWSPGNVTGSSYTVTITDDAVEEPVSVSLTNTLEATVVEPERAAFEVTKTVSGATSAAAGASFTFEYECTGPDGETADGTFELADGERISVSDLPHSSRCSVTELTPESIEGHSWVTPTLTVTGAPESSVEDHTATFVVNDDDAAIVTIDYVNTLTENPGTEEPGTEEPGTEEPGTEEPGTEQPGTEEPGTERPETRGPGADSPKAGGLAVTGGDGAGPIAATSLLLLLAGVTLLVRKRRARSEA